jgi:hypothetical protein
MREIAKLVITYRKADKLCCKRDYLQRTVLG